MITELALKKNYIKELQNIKSYKTQTKIGKSRFDFSGVDENGVEFILEVKNVPCAYYENVTTEKERKNIDSSKYKWNEKIGIFPINSPTVSITFSSFTLQKRDIFFLSTLGIALSDLQIIISGWIPKLRSSFTECCVGLVFISSDDFKNGTKVR